MGAEDFVKLHIHCRTDFALAQLTDAAELTFYRSLIYCGLNNSHGLIPRAHLPQIGPPRAAAELVTKGYWQTMPNGGWSIRSWDKWQGDFEQVAEKRKRDAERKRLKRREERSALYDGEEQP